MITVKTDTEKAVVEVMIAEKILDIIATHPDLATALNEIFYLHIKSVEAAKK